MKGAFYGSMLILNIEVRPRVTYFTPCRFFERKVGM
jgi:hypothetical protein